MKRSVYIFFSLLLAAAMLCTIGLYANNGGDKKGKKEEKEAPIRYDGVYFKKGILKAGHHQDKNYTYLRFYDDGTVVVTTSASKPEQIARHLGKTKNNGKGRYKVKGGDEISFSLRQINEQHSYEGKILDKETLQLVIYTSGMDNNYEDTFNFIQVDFSIK